MRSGSASMNSSGNHSTTGLRLSQVITRIPVRRDRHNHDKPEAFMLQPRTVLHCGTKWMKVTCDKSQTILSEPPGLVARAEWRLRYNQLTFNCGGQ